MSSVHPPLIALGSTARSTDKVTVPKVIRIGTKPRPSPRQKARARQDPRLIFILAHQTILRWELAARRLEQPIRTSAHAAALRMEVELGLRQLRTVSDRLRPFSRSRNLAVRFESEEVMARLDVVAAQLVRLQQEPTTHDPSSRLRAAKEIAERLLAKARSLARD
jgi:hypothetical protein